MPCDPMIPGARKIAAGAFELGAETPWPTGCNQRWFCERREKCMSAYGQCPHGPGGTALNVHTDGPRWFASAVERDCHLEIMRAERDWRAEIDCGMWPRVIRCIEEGVGTPVLGVFGAALRWPGLFQ